MICSAFCAVPYTSRQRLINHVSSTSDVQKIYDRYKYMPEMRQAVEKYEAFFLSLVAP
jgi:hypothetical protein